MRATSGTRRPSSSHHLAELDARRLYLAAGKSSLFTYCRDVLGLSRRAAERRWAAWVRDQA